jgi:sodium/potassium-transporting ATPase subunit alpha
VFPLQKEIVHLSRVVAALTLALDVVSFVVGWFIGLPFWANFIFAIGDACAGRDPAMAHTGSISSRVAKLKSNAA